MSDRDDTPDPLAEVRTTLIALLGALDDEERRSADDRATVVLDQTSVGRLSRMDALQRQAMAQAHSQRREVQRRRIDAALRRLAEGEYGYCTDCGDEIAPKRLELDPAQPLCLSCARG